MTFITNLLSKYTNFREKMKASAKEAEIRAEEKNKKYYLDNYGAYCNADVLTRDQMLEVFWKILEEDGYNITNFNGDTSVREPAKQKWDWDDLGDGAFVSTVYKMFGFSDYEFTDAEYKKIDTFGGYADLMIKKAKEKKLKEQKQQ